MDGWKRGPTASRQRLRPEHRLGRTLFKKVFALKHVQTPDGRLVSDPWDVHSTLWKNRDGIWNYAPPIIDVGKDVLAEYFARRRATFPARPAPSAARIASIILQQGGSAAGREDQPYEVFHHGIVFVLNLLAQSLYAAELGEEWLELVLGPSIDLLVWIPKIVDALLAEEMRPLQLPTCLRRLFGAVLADIVGPCVEPLLCTDQAARRGGACGPNIKKAYRHLDHPECCEHIGSAGWGAVLGPAAGCVWDITSELHPEHLANVPADVFADQTKAFERFSFVWIRRVLEGWNMPVWLQRAFFVAGSEPVCPGNGRWASGPPASTVM